jgi:hypothetical protein
MLSRAGLLVALCLSASARASFDPRAVEQALDELRYGDARRLVDQALQEGRHERRELAELYLFAAEIASVLDGAEAGERDFRKLLVIDPEHPLQRRTPVFAEPFARAREWVRSNGQLEVAGTVDAGPPIAVEVRVIADPLAMVDHARLWVREGPSFRALDATGLRVAAPPGLVEYWVQVLDRSGDVVAELGGAEQPLRWIAPREVPHRPPGRRSDRRLLGLGIGAGLTSLALLGGGIGFNVAARGEYHQLQTTCAPTCTQFDLNTLHTEESATYGLYVTSALFAAAAVVALLLWGLR